MAEVFRARVAEGPGLGELVAVKRLLPSQVRDPAAVALFAREAALTQALVHPNIVKVLEVGAAGPEPFIVMELVDGRDLGVILKRCKHRGIPLPVDICIYLCKALLEALAHAHSAVDEEGSPLGIVHCDVSPSNVFVSRIGEVKLGDFGVARALSGASRGEAEVHGKPYYLSPEALRGVISPATDLWAAAVLLYEVLSLSRPFTGDHPEAVFSAVRSGLFRRLSEQRPEVPAALDDVLGRALTLDPAGRFQDAEDFAQALEALLDERVGTPLAVAAVVRGLFGTSDA